MLFKSTEDECSATASLREHCTWDPDVFKTMYNRILGKITRNRDDIVGTEAVLLEDAEIVVVAYGSTSRPALEAVFTPAGNRELGSGSCALLPCSRFLTAKSRPPPRMQVPCCRSR